MPVLGSDEKQKVVKAAENLGLAIVEEGDDYVATELMKFLKLERNSISDTILSKNSGW